MNLRHSLLILSILITFPLICIGQDSIKDTVQYIDTTSITDSLEKAEEFIYYKIGDISDGNKSVPVHLIKLYDQNGYSIHKDDEYPQPFSTKYTCGDCHTYEFIKDGTHFSIDKLDTTDRVGEPYIFYDHRSLTLLPLSYRGWQGTLFPDSVGISPFSFIKYFGSHFTGGNISENDTLEHDGNFFRWQVSGKLEINCLVCHDSNPEYDQAEFAKHIKNENLKWAAAGASNLANVSGYASKMPDNFDPYNTNTFADVDLRTSPPPTINYDKTKFDENQKVFFDIEKRIDDKSCRYCHSAALNENEERYLIEYEDVHLSAGLSCIDCHKNGIDHRIIAGYEKEFIDRENELLRSYSCEGCHLGLDGNFQNGKYGAPYPKHEGIPVVHFERISCTACHSGYLPAENVKIVKTSRGHKLGVPGPNKMPSTYPLIQSPVFVRSLEGKIEPRNLIWPSYWGTEDSSGIEPLDIDLVNQYIKPLLDLDSHYNYGEWPSLTDSALVNLLDTLKIENKTNEIVLVSGGMIYKLDKDKNLISNKHDGAEPYTWPIAHNVRPAQQSLGINGCDDCHSLSSDFYFGDVDVISSVNSGRNNLSMVSFLGLNRYYESLFSLSFYFRPLLKIILIISAALISLVALSFIMTGIKSASEYFSDNGEIKEGEEI